MKAQIQLKDSSLISNYFTIISDHTTTFLSLSMKMSFIKLGGLDYNCLLTAKVTATSYAATPYKMMLYSSI